MLRWVWLVNLLAGAAWAEPGTAHRFVDDSQPWHEPAARDVDVQHLDLTVTLDPAGKVAGTAIYKGLVREAATELVLDAVDLTLDEAVWVAPGRAGKADVQKDGGKWRVTLPDGTTGSAFALRLVWHATPKRGLIFVQPDADAPRRPQHVWTQGETEEARHWLPCPDDPDERLSWNVTATAPAVWTVLSNGEFKGRTAAGAQATTRFDFAQEAPIYLLNLAAGPWTEVTHPHPTTPLRTWVLADQAADAARAYGVTPDILDALNSLTGMAYPWGRYGHVIVEDFSFGGMENVTLTTLTDRAVPDARAMLDWQVDGLVAHELAHQWFGDWLTCRTWADVWLNEGFASYFDSLVVEKRLGRERLDEEMDDARGSYLGEAAEYLRPIVTDRYRDADELFDRHTYAKGALVLHMLRRRLGDAAFFRGISAYVRSGPRSVETADFQRAMEGASSQSLRGFFARWVRQPGHPVLEAKLTWEAASSTYKIALEQKQKVTPGQPAFDLWIPLRLELAGQTVTTRYHLSGLTGEYTLRTDGRPLHVEVDPDLSVLADWTWIADADDLAAMAGRGSTAEVRLQAVRALGKQLTSAVAIGALRRAAADDASRRVRAEAARQLGKADKTDAQAALTLAAQRDPEALVRTAATAALGELHEIQTWDLLLRLARSDKSYAVVKAALQALHKLDRARAREVLRDATTWPSQRETLSATALVLLGQSGDPQDGELLRSLAKPGNSKSLREGALPALAAWAVRNEPQKESVRLMLEAMLREPNLRIRQGATGALGVLSDPASRGALLAAADREVFFRTAESMRRTAGDLGKRLSVDERIKRLEEQVEKLQRETRGKPAEKR